MPKAAILGTTFMNWLDLSSGVGSFGAKLCVTIYDSAATQSHDAIYAVT
jgi:hypothetical protein